MVRFQEYYSVVEARYANRLFMFYFCDRVLSESTLYKLFILSVLSFV